MKKRSLLSLLLCIMMLLSVFSFVACNETPDTQEKPDTPPADNENNDDTTPPADPEPQKPLETLQGKTIVWNGDSICYGTSKYGNWAPSRKTSSIKTATYATLSAPPLNKCS